MKASKLRIGNLIQRGDILPIETVTGINKNKIDTDFTNWLPIEHFTPIPITEELFVRLGFEQNKNKIRIFNLDRLRIGFGENNSMAYLIEEDTENCHYIPVTINYVHQLQNLYFALTGTELTLNPNN